MKKLLLLVLMLETLQAQLPAYKDEINHLLKYVEITKCIYIRNGDKHDGKDAQKHIKRKYDYFEDDISSSEDFIRLSATQSTMFGSKYYIKCPNEEKVKSSQWLLDELERYRKSKNQTQGN